MCIAVKDIYCTEKDIYSTAKDYVNVSRSAVAMAVLPCPPRCKTVLRYGELTTTDNPL